MKSCIRIMGVLLFTILLAVFLGACGSGGGDGDNNDDNNSLYQGSDYYPLEISNKWVYNLGTVEVDGETITIDGVTYQVVKESVVSCDEEDSGELHIAHSEESLLMHCNDCGIIGDLFVLLPKEMKVGDSWVTSLDSGGKVTHTFEGLYDITVPAGTFSDCLKIKVDVDGDYTEIFWYAKNVGWVKVERISETSPDGCIFVTSENPLAELQSALINGVSYP